jgi:hypothetical protein
MSDEARAYLKYHVEHTGLVGKATRLSGTRYLVAVAAGGLAALIMLASSYGALHLAGYLPPPPLSNNVCVDEKLTFLRKHLPKDPNLLVLGSSVAWRNIDSAAFARTVAGARPINGGFCALQMNQSAFIAGWMIDHWPSIKTVLLIVSPLDYYRCQGTAQVFDPVDVNRFVFEGAAAWSFYLRYFDPVSLVRNIKQLASYREQARDLEVVRGYTEYGDGPLDTTRDRGLFYGAVSKLDTTCFDTLRELATQFTQQGRKLVVIATPIHPEWKALYDPHGHARRQWWSQIAAALDGTGAGMWNADDANLLDARAFTDAVHLRWSAAGQFTEAIIRQLGL